MLDLDPRVHLDEEELLARGVDEELHRAGAPVADFVAQGDGGLVEPAARGVREPGRRRLLDHLLAPPLEGALALVQVDRPLTVAEHLDLDVASGGDEALDIDPRVVERSRRLAGGGLVLAVERRLVVHDPDAAAAAAAGRLERDRVADLAGHLRRLVGAGDRAVAARDGRHAHVVGRLASAGLVAHERDVLGLGTHVAQVGAFDLGREVGALGEEPVARVHAVGPAGARGLDDRAHVQVGLARGRRADLHRLIGHADVRRRLVGLAVDRHGLEPEVVSGTDDADGDLAAVGDEDPPHSPSSTTATACPAETVSSVSTRNFESVPPISASTGWKFFMISTRPMVSPAATASPSFLNGSLSGSGRR
jgi:hypothetical protein